MTRETEMRAGGRVGGVGGGEGVVQREKGGGSSTPSMLRRRDAWGVMMRAIYVWQEETMSVISLVSGSSTT